MTPKRRRSTRDMFAASTPACARASLAAASARGNTRDTCLRSRFSTQASSSNPCTSPAICTGISLGSKCEIRRTPEVPARMAFANASRPIPLGLTAPIPVTTTLRFNHSPEHDRCHYTQRCARALQLMLWSAQIHGTHAGLYNRPFICIAGGPLAYNDLRDWIAALDRAGELRKIRSEADPILEIAEITDRVSKSQSAKYGQGGPALLFQNVKGHPGSQLLINQFGSARRMNLALEVDSLDEVAERIRGFMDVKSPQGFLDKVKMLPMLAEMGKFFPKTVPTGPCKEVIKREGFSLLDFPILQCWPKDAGRFITLPCVITGDPRTGKRNVGMYRMQVYDEHTTGMHWQRQKVAAEHYRDAIRQAATTTAENGKPRLGTAAPGRPAEQSSAAMSTASAAVDIMARSSGGSILPESNRPAGKMEVAVAIGT